MNPTHSFRLLLLAAALTGATALLVTQSEPAFAQTSSCERYGTGKMCGYVSGSCDLWGCEPALVFKWTTTCPDRPINGPSCSSYGGGGDDGPPAIESTPGSDPEF